MPGSLPLDGIRVADFTQALSGPYCTMLLADLGADVVKVERPGRGDDSRHWGPSSVGDTAAYFLAVNRNKRSLELDLHSPGGRQAAAALGSLNVCVGNDQQFQRLCAALNAQQLGGDSRYQTNPLRLEHRAELTDDLSKVFRELTSADLLERLELAGVPAGPIRTLDEVFADEDVQRRAPQLRVEHEELGEVSVPGGPWRIDGEPVSARLPPPVLGQHTAQILQELGLSAQPPAHDDSRMGN